MRNYYNFRAFGKRVLITNDFGRYLWLTREEFILFTEDRYRENKELTERLEKGLFVSELSPEAFADQVAGAMADSRNYLFQGTGLHIFVVTSACNQDCIYCQAHQDAEHFRQMEWQNAQRALALAMQSPNSELSIEFQGGEPLTAFDLVKRMICYAEEHAGRKKLRFSIATNLTLLTEEMFLFFREHGIGLSTSLDGPEELHDRNRPFLTGGGTYQKVTANLRRAQQAGVPCGALMTTTRFSFPYAEAIAEEYRKNGLHMVSVRPLTPLGSAASTWTKIGYSAEEFVEFYRRVFYAILKINREGYLLREGMASIFLHKILGGYAENFMELRSPCGACVGQIAYDFDGDVYSCDEGRMLAAMGDKTFQIGNVRTDDYNSLMESSVCRTMLSASILESLPSCSSCVYQPYCGACPVVNYSLYRDLYETEPEQYRCRINKGMLDLIFHVLQNPENEKILRRWIS